MISRTGYRPALLLMLAGAVSLSVTIRASAQTAPAGEDPWGPVKQDMTTSDVAAPAADDADTRDQADAKSADAETADAKNLDAKSLENQDLDWSLLSADASPVTNVAPKARRARPAQPSPHVSWSSKDQPNGAAAVTVKRPLSTFWDARIGADMTVAPASPPLTESEQLAKRLANGGNLPQSSGTAWAAITAPGVGSIWDKTSVEARIDPAQEQSKLGTSISKSLPLNKEYSLTLQNGYNVVEQGVVPVPGVAGQTVRSYETEQSAKLSIAGTGTSLIAGQSLSSDNDKWLHSIGAEQKLFGGVNVKGSIGETAQGTSSKSVSVGFNRSW
jgi:hypothetical protein